MQAIEYAHKLSESEAIAQEAVKVKDQSESELKAQAAIALDHYDKYQRELVEHAAAVTQLNAAKETVRTLQAQVCFFCLDCWTFRA